MILSIWNCSMDDREIYRYNQTNPGFTMIMTRKQDEDKWGIG